MRAHRAILSYKPTLEAPMSTTPPSGYGSIAWTMTLAGSTRAAVVTAGFRNVVATTALGARTALDVIWTGTGHAFDAALMDAQWSLTGVYVLLNTAGVLTSDTAALSVVGTVSGQVMPPNCSMVIQRRTVLAGRQYRGHISMPLHSVDSGDVSDAGVIDAGVVSSWQTKYTAILAAMVTANLPMYLLHGPDKLGVTPVPTQVSSLSVDSMIGTQRRRLRR